MCRDFSYARFFLCNAIDERARHTAVPRTKNILHKVNQLIRNTKHDNDDDEYYMKPLGIGHRDTPVDIYIHIP